MHEESDLDVEDFDNEWQRHVIVLPEDDFDEDDEEDLRIAKAERKQREHVTRGQFHGT